MIPPDREPITCACCSWPFAEWRGARLVIVAKHHEPAGRHANTVTVDMFLERMTPEQLGELKQRVEWLVARCDRIGV